VRADEPRSDERDPRRGGEAEPGREQRGANANGLGGRRDRELRDEVGLDPRARRIREPRRLATGLDQGGHVLLENGLG